MTRGVVPWLTVISSGRASRFAIGKTAVIKVFGSAKILGDDIHPLRLAECMSNPKIERVR
jgi:hypothetical protein